MDILRLSEAKNKYRALTAVLALGLGSVAVACGNDDYVPVEYHGDGTRTITYDQKDNLLGVRSADVKERCAGTALITQTIGGGAFKDSSTNAIPNHPDCRDGKLTPADSPPAQQ